MQASPPTRRGRVGDREEDRTRAPPASELATAAEDDAVVMGESHPSVTTFVFGETVPEVGDRFHGPALTVRRRSGEGAPAESTVHVESDGSEE